MRSLWHVSKYIARRQAWCRVLLALCAVYSLAGCATIRTVVVTTVPSDAIVKIDGKVFGAHEGKLSWQSGESHLLEVEAVGYAAQAMDLTSKQAVRARSPWKIPITLKQTRTTRTFRIGAWPETARVLVGNDVRQVSRGMFELAFHRAADAAEWRKITVCAELENYKTTCHTVSVDTAPPLQLQLTELRRVVQLEIQSNIEGARVLINGESQAETPLARPIPLVFERASGDMPWNRHEVTVEKDNYRWRRPEGAVVPGAIDTFREVIELPQGRRTTSQVVADLEPIQFYRTVAREWDFSGDDPALAERIVLATRRRPDQPSDSAQRIHRFESDGFALSQLAVMPGTDRVLYSYSVKDDNRARLTTELRWVQQGKETRLFGDGSIALDPTVDAAGNFIYSCVRRGGSGGFEISRISATGKGGVTRIVDRDPGVRYAEPALKQNGQNLAYVAHYPGTEEGQLYVTPVNGGLQTAIGAGRQPAWATDNKRLAFVRRNDEGFDHIWVFDQVESVETQITPNSERWHHRYPAWTSQFDRIVFAANAVLNEEGERHFDIHMMKADGTGVRRLTLNGSFDSYPALDPNGQYIYFISNRDADHENDNSWAIWRMELPRD